MDIAYSLQVKLNALFDSSDIEKYREAWLAMLLRDEQAFLQQHTPLSNGNAEIIASVRRMAESCIRETVYNKILSNDDMSPKLYSKEMIDLIDSFRKKMKASNIKTEETPIVLEDAMAKCLPGCYGMGKNR